VGSTAERSAKLDAIPVTHHLVERWVEDRQREVRQQAARDADHLHHRDIDGDLPEILAWQGEPEAHVLCSPDGVLRLRGVELATWQAIETPRRRDDSERRPDRPPDEQLVAMFKRLKVAMNAWMEALDHLSPSN
jgi:hypothetical protein